MKLKVRGPLPTAQCQNYLYVQQARDLDKYAVLGHNVISKPECVYRISSKEGYGGVQDFSAIKEDTILLCYLTENGLELVKEEV